MKRYFFLLALFLLSSFPIHADEFQTQLGIEGSKFTINGEPRFLIGASYYGGLGAPNEIRDRDLQTLKEYGFNWIRVWATWESFGENVSAFKSTGQLRPIYLQRLIELVAACDERGIIVDVTLARVNVPGQFSPAAHLSGFDAHEQAIRTLTDALRSHRNWYIDLANERDVQDFRYVPLNELQQLRNLTRGLAPKLPITASFGGHDLSLQEVRDAIHKAKFDFLAVHRPRQPGTAKRTERKTRQVLQYTIDEKKEVPVHQQEPFRRGYGNWEPMTDDFILDLRGAIRGGAAGWCFHNGATKTNRQGIPRRSFDLREKSLFEQLDEEEMAFVKSVKQILKEELK
ncbi:MAG: hypothetical protein KDA65_15555 [Planctomycetaceae bacterium]|nr:hypothetical protein [Planctomycetaceae bacterium]